MSVILGTTDITFTFDNDNYMDYITREKLRREHIFGYANPINFYAKIVGYYKQDEILENYNFSDIYQILTLVMNNYNVQKYDDFYVHLPDDRKISHKKLLKCYDIFNHFACLGLLIAFDYSMNELGGSKHKYLACETQLHRLEGLKGVSLEAYRSRIADYMHRLFRIIEKDKNANKTNLFFLILGYKCIDHFKYSNTPPVALADLVININDVINRSFDNWYMLNVAKQDNIIISKYSINKLRKELKAQQEAQQRKYNELLKEFNKLNTEYDCIAFIEEHAKKSGSLYARGYVNPINAPERTTVVRISYNPNNDGHEWDCSVRDYNNNDDYNGSDSDMPRRYLASAWYETFTTETKLNIIVDGMSFEKELK